LRGGCRSGGPVAGQLRGCRGRGLNGPSSRPASFLSCFGYDTRKGPVTAVGGGRAPAWATGPQRLAPAARRSTMSHPKQVRLAGSVLDRSRHVCAFFHSKDEEYRVLLPFIKEGFEQGDRAFHILDAHRRQDHMRRLQEAGIDTARAEAEERLLIRHWEDTYLQDGPFDQHR